MQRILAYILSFYCFALCFANGVDVPADLPGDYATIDVRLMNITIQSLLKSEGTARAQIISAITNKPENFAPPVLYCMSRVLIDEGQKDEAMFWFFAGQLRGRIDANICADKSAPAAIAALNQKFGPTINQYAFNDIPRLTNTFEHVLIWEAKTPCEYDRRWINLLGTNVMNGDTNAPLSAPKEQWETIRKNTRDEFRSRFYQALAEVRKMKH